MGLFGKKRERQVWRQEADFEEKGSFCDTDSQIHHDNQSAFDSEVTMRNASDSGDEVIDIDAPADPDDSYGSGQRFNVTYTENDSQGAYHPRKYSPGR